MSLKKCPFCNGEANLSASKNIKGDEELVRYQITCGGCGVRTPAYFVDISFVRPDLCEFETANARETLTDRWNQRTDTAVDPEIVGSMEVTAKMVTAALHAFDMRTYSSTEMHKALMAAIAVARKSKE